MPRALVLLAALTLAGCPSDPPAGGEDGGAGEDAATLDSGGDDDAGGDDAGGEDDAGQEDASREDAGGDGDAGPEDAGNEDARPDDAGDDDAGGGEDAGTDAGVDAPACDPDECDDSNACNGVEGCVDGACATIMDAPDCVESHPEPVLCFVSRGCDPEAGCVYDEVDRDMDTVVCTLDCNDQSEDAFPGQTEYFASSHTGDPGYDYDCDGREEPQLMLPVVEGTFGGSDTTDVCTLAARLGCPERVWVDREPACGTFGWLAFCATGAGGRCFPSAEPHGEQQLCR